MRAQTKKYGKAIRLIAIALAALSVFALASCGNEAEKAEEAKQALTDVMEGFKSGDEEIVGRYADLSSDPDLASLLTSSLENMSYEIKSVTVDGNKAEVELSLTTVDSTQIMQKYIESVAAMVSGEDYQSRIDTMTKEEYDKLMDEQLENILTGGEVGTVTSDEKVSLTKENGEWKLGDSSLGDKLLGNTLSAIKQIKQ